MLVLLLTNPGLLTSPCRDTLSSFIVQSSRIAEVFNEIDEGIKDMNAFLDRCAEYFPVCE